MVNIYLIKKYAAILALTVSVAFLLTACSKDEYLTGTITVTTAKSEVGFIIRTPKDSRNLTIDWGDGKKSNVNDAS